MLIYIMKLKQQSAFFGWSLSAMALVAMVFAPLSAQAEVSIISSQCPAPSACDNTGGGSPLWPGGVGFSICNTTISPWTLYGFRWKTTNFNGFITYGGPAVTISGAGPYTYQQMVATSDYIRPAGSCLTSYSLGNPVGAGKNGQPYDYDILLKNGSCSPVNPFPTPTPMTCTDVVNASNVVSFYDPTVCVSQWMGKNGGSDSGGLINTFFGQTQIQVAKPAGGWTISGTSITWDPVAGMGNSPMYLMASAMGQEYLNLDQYFMFGIGAKEHFAGAMNPGSLFITVDSAGVAGTYSSEDTTYDAIVAAYPGFFKDYACVAGYPNVTTAIGTACLPTADAALFHYVSQTPPGGTSLINNNAAQLVNSVFAAGFNFYRIYDALMASTDLCFKNLLEGGNDPWAAARILPGAYNLGINSGFYSSALPASAGELAATDISSYVAIGNGNYEPEVLLTASTLSNASKACPHVNGVWDPPISQTDLQNFFFGNGGTAGALGSGGLVRQFGMTNAQQTAMWAQVLCAFNALKGRAPSTLATNNISYRYDFLSILRVARGYFSLQRPFPTQSDFTDWVTTHSTTNGSACGIVSDTTFPTITGLTPAQNSNVCPNFLVTMNATDNVGITAVDYSLDPNWQSFTTVPGSSPFSFNVPGSDPNFPASGPGKLWIRIADGCGNQTVRELDFNVNCGTPTFTVTPTRTPTPTPTASPTDTRTATPSVSPSRTSTSTSSATSTGTPTASITVTPSPSPTRTATASATVSSSATPSLSPSPSRTVTASPSGSPTSSTTVTSAFTSSNTPSATPSPSRSASPTVSASRTASSTSTVTAQATATPTSSSTASASVTLSSSASPTAPGTFTNTPTYSSTFTASATRTVSPTLTQSPSSSATPSASASASVTVSSSSTSTRTESATLTASSTATATRTETTTRTASATSSASVTQSQTSTQSVTATISATQTPYLSPTITMTFSASPTRALFVPQDHLIKVRGIYPNPFSDRVRVYYTLRVDAQVSMDVYNVAGEPIRSIDQPGKAGVNELIWDGFAGPGGRCASGVYVLHLKAEGVDRTRDGFWDTAVIAR